MSSQIERIQTEYRILLKQGVKAARLRLSVKVHAELLEEFRKLSMTPGTLPRGVDIQAISSLFGLPVIIDSSEQDFKIEVEV